MDKTSDPSYAEMMRILSEVQKRLDRLEQASGKPIRELVPQVAAERVAALAVEARVRMKLRHLPLLLVREMARHATHRALVANTLEHYPYYCRPFSQCLNHATAFSGVI